jgi:integrase
MLLYPDATNDFLAWGRDTNRFHGTTAATYEVPLKALQGYFPGRPVEEIMTVDRILEYTWSRAPVGQPGWSEGTADTYLRAYKSFSRYGHRRGLCDDLRDSLTDAFPVKRRTRRQAHWLSSEDVRAIVDACPPGVTGDRDKFLILLGVFTGLRREELSSLQWNHIDLRHQMLWVPSGKGDKERYVGLMPEAIEVIGEWKDRCASDLGAVPSLHPVLPTIGFRHVLPNRGQYLWWDRPAKEWFHQRTPPKSPYWALGYNQIGQIVTRAGERVGIEGLMTHDLRRSFAGLLEEAGVPVVNISAQLGHSDISTTQTYLESNPRKRAGAMAKVVIGLR